MEVTNSMQALCKALNEAIESLSEEQRSKLLRAVSAWVDDDGARSLAVGEQQRNEDAQALLWELVKRSS
jgi:hypothetical protein